MKKPEVERWMNIAMGQVTGYGSEYAEPVELPVGL